MSRVARGSASMPRNHLTQTQRNALAELLGSISDTPHGDLLAGRAFEMLRSPMYDLIMDIVEGDEGNIAESIRELAKTRGSVRSIGLG
jgi:hypothetical protein